MRAHLPHRARGKDFYQAFAAYGRLVGRDQANPVAQARAHLHPQKDQAYEPIVRSER